MTDANAHAVAPRPSDQAGIPPPPHFMRCLTPRDFDQRNSFDTAPIITFDELGRCRVRIDDEFRPDRRVPLTSAHWAVLGVMCAIFFGFGTTIYRKTGSLIAALSMASGLVIALPILFVLHGMPVRTLIPRRSRNTIGATFDPAADRVDCDLARVRRRFSDLAGIQVLQGSVEAGMGLPWQLTFIFRTPGGFERVLIHTGYGEPEDRHRSLLARLGLLLGVRVEFFRIRGWRTPVQDIFLDQARLGRAKRPEANAVVAAALKPLGPAWDALGRSRFDAHAEPILGVTAPTT
jgi:hypothetical protein